MALSPQLYDLIICHIETCVMYESMTQFPIINELLIHKMSISLFAKFGNRCINAFISDNCYIVFGNNKRIIEKITGTDTHYNRDAIVWFSERSTLDIIKRLVNTHGTDILLVNLINKRRERYSNVLYIALRNKNMKICKYILKVSPDIIRNNSDCHFDLFNNIISDRYKGETNKWTHELPLFDLLIKYGADINVRGYVCHFCEHELTVTCSPKKDVSLLIVAVRYCKLNIIKYLIEKNIVIMESDNGSYYGNNVSFSGRFEKEYCVMDNESEDNESNNDNIL